MPWELLSVPTRIGNQFIDTNSENNGTTWVVFKTLNGICLSRTVSKWKELTHY